MIDVGRICVKIAGRDARKKCVIVEVIDDIFVIIDGETRRKRCNVKHLEPLEQTIKIKKGASHSTIVSEFKKLDIEIKDKKSKPKTEKPKKQRKKKEKEVEEPTKKTTKKDSSKKGNKNNESNSKK